MCSDKNKPFNYKYYAVEILDPQYEELERFFCIPASWIQVKESDQRVLVSFPLDVEASVVKQRVKDGKEFSASWTVFVADIKYGADSYEDAINYITVIENRLLQEQSYAEIIKEHIVSSTSIETNSPASSLNTDLELTAPHEIVTEPSDLNKDIREQQPEEVEIGDTLIEKMGDSPPDDTNSKTYETFVDDHNPGESAEDIIKLIFETDFLDQLKEKHSALVEQQIRMGKIHLDYINMTSIMKKIIHLVENYKKCYIDQPHIATTEDNRDIDVDDIEKDEGIINEEAKTNTTQGKQESHGINVVNEIIDNDRNVQNRQPKQQRPMRKFTLPEEYDKNDSRWTLRHPNKKPGLVELIPHSRVYVNGIKLQNCKIISNDSRTFARLLLVEIFSDNALRVCSLTGRIAHTYKRITNEYVQRPGLDENARMVLFNYVEQYGKERNWPVFDDRSITFGVTNKLRESRAKAL